MGIRLSDRTKMKIAEATLLSAALIETMAGYGASSIAEAQRLVDSGNSLGDSTIQMIRREAKKYQ